MPFLYLVSTDNFIKNINELYNELCWCSISCNNICVWLLDNYCSKSSSVSRFEHSSSSSSESDLESWSSESWIERIIKISTLKKIFYSFSNSAVGNFVDEESPDHVENKENWEQSIKDIVGGKHLQDLKRLNRRAGKHNRYKFKYFNNSDLRRL